MAKYLFIADYNSEGIKGLVKNGGTSRADALKKAIEGVGGKLESFYFAFGGEDAFVTAELPDNAAAAALALTAASSGQVGVRTVVLMTPGEIDEAAKRQIDYKPPA